MEGRQSHGCLCGHPTSSSGALIAIYPAPGSSLSGSSYSITKDVGVCFILLSFHCSTFFISFPGSLGPCSLQAGYLSDPVTALPWDQKPSQPLDTDQELVSWIYLRQHVCLPALQEDDRPRTYQVKVDQGCCSKRAVPSWLHKAQTRAQQEGTALHGSATLTNKTQEKAREEASQGDNKRHKFSVRAER